MEFAQEDENGQMWGAGALVRLAAIGGSGRTQEGNSFVVWGYKVEKFR